MQWYHHNDVKPKDGVLYIKEKSIVQFTKEKDVESYTLDNNLEYILNDFFVCQKLKGVGDYSFRYCSILIIYCK